MKRVMLSLFVILFLFSPLVFAVDLPDAPSMPVVDSGLVGSSYTWLWVALGFVALGVIFYFLYNYFSKKTKFGKPSNTVVAVVLALVIVLGSVGLVYFGGQSVGYVISNVDSFVGDSRFNEYAPPFDVKSDNRQIFSLEEPTLVDGSVVVKGSVSYSDGLIWDKAYVLVDENGLRWREVSLEGDIFVRGFNWLANSAGFTQQLSLDILDEGENFAVVYVCKMYEEWKCGCRDEACDRGRWTLQTFNVVKPIVEEEAKTCEELGCRYACIDVNGNSKCVSSCEDFRVFNKCLNNKIVQIYSGCGQEIPGDVVDRCSDTCAMVEVVKGDVVGYRAQCVEGDLGGGACVENSECASWVCLEGGCVDLPVNPNAPGGLIEEVGGEGIPEEGPESGSDGSSVIGSVNECYDKDLYVVNYDQGGFEVSKSLSDSCDHMCLQDNGVAKCMKSCEDFVSVFRCKNNNIFGSFSGCGERVEGVIKVCSEGTECQMVVDNEPDCIIIDVEEEILFLYGEECRVDGQCETGFCLDEVCRNKDVPESGECKVNGECEVGFCFFGKCKPYAS